MNDSQAKKIMKNLQNLYEQIADDFSESRAAPWPEFHFFKKFISEGDDVVELGCGNGRAYQFLREKKIEYLGIDFSKKLLDIARKRYPDTSFQRQDLTDMRLENKKYDAVISVASLHHIPSKRLRKKVFKKISVALKDDGILIFSVWYLWRWKFFREIMTSVLRSIFTLGRYEWNDIFRRWKGNEFTVKPLYRYYHAFTQREIEILLRESGFEVIEHQISEDPSGHRRNYLFACRKVMLKAQQQPLFVKEKEKAHSHEFQPAIMSKY